MWMARVEKPFMRAGSMVGFMAAPPVSLHRVRGALPTGEQLDEVDLRQDGDDALGCVDDAPFSGNPLCVFEDGQPFSTDDIQALARQFNLSETTITGRGYLSIARSGERPIRSRPRLDAGYASHS